MSILGDIALTIFGILFLLTVTGFWDFVGLWAREREEKKKQKENANST